MSPRVLTGAVLAIALAISAYSDLRYRKIWNWVTFPAMAVGVALHTWGGWGRDVSVWDATGWKSALVGLAVGFGFFLILYLVGGMAEGDVKLMGAVGALAGLKVTVVALFAVAIAGGIEAVLVLLWKGRLWSTIKGMARRASRERIAVPYGVAIAAGTAWAWWWVYVEERAAALVRAAAMGGMP